MNIIALDIGGTAVKYGLFFNGEENFGQFSVYDSNGTEDVQNSLYDFLGNYNADCIAISVPGPFDFKTGTSNMKHKLNSLYGVSLRKILEEKFPDTAITFIHDSTSFAYGVMSEKPELKNEIFACVMLGTGIGYVNVRNGLVELNDKGTPLNPMWNMRYFNGIAEDYISTNALLTNARKKGYVFNNIKEMAETSRNGNDVIRNVFNEFGRHLGECIEIKRSEDGFGKVVIGGQISKSFDLIRSGFECKTDTEYLFVKDPSKCALYGLKTYVDV